MKDKGVAGGGVPAKVSEKRASRKKAEVPGERDRSPIQALRSAVKKAASTKTNGRKPRR